MNGVILFIDINEKTIEVILMQEGHVVVHELKKKAPLNINIQHMKMNY